jgi:hypothetical protein
MPLSIGESGPELINIKEEEEEDLQIDPVLFDFQT